MARAKAAMDRLSGLPDDVIFHIISFLPLKCSIRTSILARRWRFKWANAPSLGFTRSRHSEKFMLIDQKLSNIFHRVSPALKKLKLVNIVPGSKASLEHLISGCPVIEELVIERMLYSCGFGNIYVVAPNLTRLVIDIDEVFFVGFKIPKLRYLRLCSRNHSGIFACPLDSLVEADVDVAHESNYINPYSFIKFVAALCNVKRLTLSTRPLEAPDSQFRDSVFKKFCNLTELNVGADCRCITLLLENADNLRVLTIRKFDPYWMVPKQTPACLESHLETVNLVDFGWTTDHEFDMVKYILMNAKVLKDLKIICTPDCTIDSSVKHEAIERLVMISRCLGLPNVISFYFT